MEIISFIKNFFSLGDVRTLKTKKSVLSLFIIRMIGMPISFVLMPLTINYVSEESYGIWLTISSVVAWMGFFDIGINNGLRNKLTESIAKKDDVLSKKYVSTTYAILSFISLTIFLVFLIVNSFVDWSLVLKISPKLTQELSKVALIVVGYFCLKFVLSTVNIIFLSHQQPGRASFRGLIEQISSLIAIAILVKYTSGSLLNLAYGLCIPPLLVLIYYNFNLFFGKLKNIAPSYKYIDFKLTKSLTGLGFKFFVIQIAGIIQFQTANFIIIRNFGAGDVTVYNAAYKYFSILTMLMGIFTIPLWSAVTDAYARNDNVWIKNAEKKFRKIAIGLIAVGVIMLLLSDYAYKIWLGNNMIFIPFKVSFFMFLFSILYMFGGIYNIILNGISALNIQYIASLISPIVFVLTSYILINYFNLGIVSVIIAAILANFNGYFLAPWQYRRIFIKNKLTIK